MNFLILLACLIPSLTLEEKIKVLNPNVSKDSLALVVEVLTSELPKLGLSEDLVLATIHKESNFQRMYVAGASGEWGMLQVIPSDAHIQTASKKYRCNEEEQKKVVVENNSSFKLCRCPVGGSVCNLPNIGSLVGNTYKVNPIKLALFFKHSQRAGLFVGLHELAYWKRTYDRVLKARYWDIFPAYLFPVGEREFFRKWWQETKDTLKENTWIAHHNWGGVMKSSHASRWYPRMIYKQLLKLEKAKKNAQQKSDNS
jgi:hypothetical protein